MKSGEYLAVADVQAVEKKQNTPIREGDVVLFHTGWTDAMLQSDPQAWVSGAPGPAKVKGAVQMIINPVVTR